MNRTEEEEEVNSISKNPHLLALGGGIYFFDVFLDSPLDGWIPSMAEDGVVVLGDVLPVILNEVKHLLGGIFPADASYLSMTGIV